MSALSVAYIIALMGILAFFVCRAAARRERQGQKMHSRPAYYGWWACFLAIVPPLLFLLLWSWGCNGYLQHKYLGLLPHEAVSGAQTGNMAVARGLDKLILRDLADNLPALARGGADYSHASYAEIQQKLLKDKDISLAPDGRDDMVPLAAAWAGQEALLGRIGAAIAFMLALAACICGYMQVRPRARARNKMERVISVSLFLAALLAVAVTAGIVLSMLFQTAQFFRSVSFANFFFGTVWDPRFSAAAGGAQGQFGLLPLLAGTAYIAAVAMLFAVPIGLFAAIYMSEYAAPRLRAFIKPLLEILAGIPTIVYGFFALMTVGPFLRDISAALAGGQGFIQAQSVLTAGFVMGIMLIPFVSSLSDDIISAVPHSLREGSYGLGATQSETIKKVVLPAALPGIVAALLLTASRAIGETMIVVLAAGVAANITLNPFEPMTTITVKIVNQLTGDLEFNTPQTLVAFALGMTLFILTLLMNIFALYVVRKYREQYE